MALRSKTCHKQKPGVSRRSGVPCFVPSCVCVLTRGGLLRGLAGAHQALPPFVTAPFLPGWLRSEGSLGKLFPAVSHPCPCPPLPAAGPGQACPWHSPAREHPEPGSVSAGDSASWKGNGKPGLLCFPGSLFQNVRAPLIHMDSVSSAPSPRVAVPGTDVTLSLLNPAWLFSREAFIQKKMTHAHSHHSTIPRAQPQTSEVAGACRARVLILLGLVWE